MIGVYRCTRHGFIGCECDNEPKCASCESLQKKVDRLTRSNTALLNSKHKAEKEAKLWFDRFQALDEELATETRKRVDAESDLLFARINSMYCPNHKNFTPNCFQCSKKRIEETLFNLDE